MSTIDSDIAMLKSRINAAQLSKARAQAITETAQASYDSAMLAIQTEFGLDKLEDARDKLVDLQAELQALVDDVAVKLDAMEL